MKFPRKLKSRLPLHVLGVTYYTFKKLYLFRYLAFTFISARYKYKK